MSKTNPALCLVHDQESGKKFNLPYARFFRRPSLWHFYVGLGTSCSATFCQLFVYRATSFVSSKFFWFRFWIMPELSAPVPLDKGNGGCGNKIGSSTDETLHHYRDCANFWLWLESVFLVLTKRRADTGDENANYQVSCDRLPTTSFPKLNVMMFQPSNDSSFSPVQFKWVTFNWHTVFISSTCIPS